MKYLLRLSIYNFNYTTIDSIRHPDQTTVATRLDAYLIFKLTSLMFWPQDRGNFLIWTDRKQSTFWLLILLPD